MDQNIDFPNGALVMDSFTMHDQYFDNEAPGYAYLVQYGNKVTQLNIYPVSGGYYHGGTFDADGEWPQIGDTIFKVESTAGEGDDPEHGGAFTWEAVRIVSSRGDMRAMVRDVGDDYGYGAGLRDVLVEPEWEDVAQWLLQQIEGEVT